MDQVSAISAPSVEHTHALRNISAQDLIEYVNIDLTELFLNVPRHVTAFLSVRLRAPQFFHLKTGDSKSRSRD
jgi:hypothetical protein